MVGTVFGHEDGNRIVNKLWISGPKALPAESKTGPGGTEKAG